MDLSSRLWPSYDQPLPAATFGSRWTDDASRRIVVTVMMPWPFTLAGGSPRRIRKIKMKRWEATSIVRSRFSRKVTLELGVELPSIAALAHLRRRPTSDRDSRRLEITKSVLASARASVHPPLCLLVYIRSVHFDSEVRGDLPVKRENSKTLVNNIYLPSATSLIMVCVSGRTRSYLCSS